MPFAEDLSVFFNSVEFAQSVTLDGVAVNAIFDNGYSSATGGAYGMASTQPSLTLPTVSVPANPVAQAAVVNVFGTVVNYTVAAHEPDGTGISRLLLETA